MSTGSGGAVPASLHSRPQVGTPELKRSLRALSRRRRDGEARPTVPRGKKYHSGYARSSPRRLRICAQMKPGQALGVRSCPPSQETQAAGNLSGRNGHGLSGRTGSGRCPVGTSRAAQDRGSRCLLPHPGPRQFSMLSGFSKRRFDSFQIRPASPTPDDLPARRILAP